MSASPATELPAILINYQRNYHSQFEIQSLLEEGLLFSNLTIKGATA